MAYEAERKIALAREDVEEQLMSADRHRNEAKQERGNEQQTWHGAAFVLETVVLIFFLAVSLVVIASLFGAAHQKGQDASDITFALVLATTEAENGAETFAANPTDPSAPTMSYYRVEDGVFVRVPVYTAGAYTVRRDVTPTPLEGGTLYNAKITVVRHERVLYVLETSSYVSERRG